MGQLLDPDSRPSAQSTKINKVSLLYQVFGLCRCGSFNLTASRCFRKMNAIHDTHNPASTSLSPRSFDWLDDLADRHHQIASAHFAARGLRVRENAEDPIAKFEPLESGWLGLGRRAILDRSFLPVPAILPKSDCQHTFSRRLPNLGCDDAAK